MLSVGLPFPATNTSFGVREEATAAYAAFSPLTHPGTFLLICALFGYLMFKWQGRYGEGASALGVLGRAAKDALPVTMSVSALLLIRRDYGACARLERGGGKYGLSRICEFHRYHWIVEHLAPRTSFSARFRRPAPRLKEYPSRLCLEHRPPARPSAIPSPPRMPCSAPRLSAIRLSSEACFDWPSPGPSRPACSSRSQHLPWQRILGGGG